MNTPVSFEIAKLLKGKGFPQPKSVYQASQHGLHFTWYNRDGVYMASYNLGDTVQAPTITEVVMWLYENHGIWISVEQNSFIGGGKSSFISNVERKEYNSPTEAYSQAIEYTLKNLI